jgi:hypothetical protein
MFDSESSDGEDAQPRAQKRSRASRGAESEDGDVMAAAYPELETLQRAPSPSTGRVFQVGLQVVPVGMSGPRGRPCRRSERRTTRALNTATF